MKLPVSAFSRILLVLGGILAISIAALATDTIMGPGTLDLGGKLFVHTNGNVGIGILAPGPKLDVAGGIRAMARTAPAQGAGLELHYDPDVPQGQIYAFDRSKGVYNDLNLNDFMVVKNNTKVGIGTIAPTAHLHVVSNASKLWLNGVNITKDFTGGGDGHAVAVISAFDWLEGETGIRVGYKQGGFDANTSYSLAVFGNGQPVMVVHPHGNVGIGNTTPGQKLTVAGVVESTSGGFKFPDGTVQTTAAEGGGFSCPSGFTIIQNQGQTLGCMQTSENGAASWLNAANACWTAHGGRLPTHNEWYVSMNNYDLLQETDNSEWLQEPLYVAGDVHHTAGDGALSNMGSDSSGALHGYRCFILASGLPPMPG